MHNGQKKRTKGQTIIYKILHIKQKTEQQKTYKYPGVNSGAMEGWTVLVPLVTPVVLHSICMCCLHVATYIWKVHNGKIAIISFVVITFLTTLSVNCVDQGMTQTQLYLWYPLFQSQWKTVFTQNTLNVFTHYTLKIVSKGQ